MESLLLRKLQNLKFERSNLQQDIECAILCEADAKKEKENMDKKEVTIREMLLDQVHIKKNGQPREHAHFDQNKNLFYAVLNDGGRMYGKDKLTLLRKLCEYYHIDLQDYSYGAIWDLAESAYERKYPERQKTIKDRRNDYRRYISDDFAKKDIRELTSDEVFIYLKKLVIDQNLKTSRAKAAKNIIMFAFNFAYEKGYLRNRIIIPSDELRSVWALTDHSVAKRSAIDVMYSPDEEKKLWEEIDYRANDANNPFYNPSYSRMARFQNLTGLRPGELCALREENVIYYMDSANRKKASLHVVGFQRITSAPRECVYIDYTKNEKGNSKGGRMIPLMDDALAIIEEAIQFKRANNIESDWLFVKFNGDWCDRDGYSKWLKRINDKLGMNRRGTYAFRRNFNNTMKRAGVDVTNRSKILGNSPDVNSGYYTFEDFGYEDDVRARLNNYNESQKE